MSLKKMAAVWIVVGLFLPALPALSDGPAAIEELADLMATAEYGPAEERAREILTRLETEGAALTGEAAEILDILLEARWRSGKATDPETLEIGERSLAIKKRVLGPTDAGVGKTLHHLAILAFFRGDYGEASGLWEQAIAIREAALGADHPDVAESQNGLANLYQMTGDFDDAKRLYASAVKIRRDVYGPADPRVGHTLNNLGHLMMTTGDYAGAIRIAEQSLEIKQNTFGPEHPEMAVGYLTLGQALDETGDIERAREYARKGVEILEKAHGPDHSAVATALNNLAEQMRRRGEYAEARPLYERALAIWEKVDPEHREIGVALTNLSMLLAATGDLEQARVLQERGVEARIKAHGEEHPRVALSLNNLGHVLARLGRDEAAAGAFERALIIRRTAYGDEHPSVAASLNGLALVHSRLGQTARALDEALEAERIARDHLRLTGRTLSEAHALSYAAQREGGLDLALTLAAEHESVVSPRSTLDELIRSRAVVLDEMAARHRSVATTTDPEIARLAAELTRARSRLANLTVRGVGSSSVESYRRFFEEARDEKEKAERALGGASADFARQQQRSRLGLEQVERHLPAGSALVAYVAYEQMDVRPAAKRKETEVSTPTPNDPLPSYAALVFRAGVEPRIVRLGPASDLAAAVQRWKKEAATGATNIRRTPAESEQAYRETASELRDLIWDPVASLLPENTRRVFLVPDGTLNLVSMAALPAGESGYLVESGPTLHYVSAERDLVPADDAASGHGMLALGNPDYDTTGLFAALSGPGSSGDAAASGARTRGAGCGDFESLRFEPLPATAVETEEIAAIWSTTLDDRAAPEDRGLRLTEEKATEAAFKKAAVGRRILHVATHGFFLGKDCGGAGGTRGFTVVESKPEAKQPLLETPISPLLLSGLALAGANNRRAAGAEEEDGVLTAEEIGGLDLSGVEWAVLSACDTGVGEIRAGEGVYGLRRAMQVAGVRTLIMSLWPVDDEATRNWMTALYDGRLSKKLDSAAAVRAAGRSVLERRRDAGESTHPFYWAAFVGAGDWR